jgi:heme exporter protein C
MKQNWWKFVGAALLIFSFCAGMLTRLEPGILTTVADRAATSEGPFKVSVSAYNTAFTSDCADIQVWLVSDTARKIKTCASSVTVIDDQHLEAEFPPVAPAGKDPYFGLAVFYPCDKGVLMYKPEAIYTTDTVPGTIIQSCTPDVSVQEAGRFEFPFRYILYESIRNLYFHVPMWFTMIALLSWAVLNNLRFLRKLDSRFDRMADQAIKAALLFGVLGLITGSLWARVTWGAWWVDDVKLNGTAITLLAYLAYLVLRGSMEDQQKRARIGAIYSIFAFVMMIALIGILPRLQQTDTLHPGNGGNPAFSNYDLDNTMRMVFYPAVAGWVLIGFWIYSIRNRMQEAKEWIESK